MTDTTPKEETPRCPKCDMPIDAEPQEYCASIAALRSEVEALRKRNQELERLLERARLPCHRSHPHEDDPDCPFNSAIHVAVIRRNSELHVSNAELERLLDEAKAEPLFSQRLVPKLISERDAALAQVGALREALEASQTWLYNHPQQEGQENRRKLNEAVLSNTSATAQQFVEKVRREALEEAVDRVDAYVNQLHPPMGRAAAPLRAAILGEKEK